MDRVLIEVPDRNDSLSRVVLSGKQYLIRFSYILSYDYWTFGLYTILQDPILIGAKILPRFPLTAYCSRPGMPGGAFGVFTKLEHIGRAAFRDGNAEFAYITG